MNNYSVSPEVIGALIGVGGTIIGTVLGWTLNRLSQSGHLKFYSSISGMPHKRDNFGAFQNCGKLEEADSYTCYIDLDIYNQNANYKTIKDVKLHFISENDNFYRVPTIKEPELNKIVKEDVINITPKQTISIRLSVVFDKESFDDLKMIRGIKLNYKNEKNKIKIVPFTNDFKVSEMN